MWATKTENDRMNMTIVITLCMGVVYHMDEFHLEVMGGIRTHKHIIFFVQYKTAMAPSIWYTRWQTHAAPSTLHCLYINFWAVIISCLISQSIFYTTRRGKGKSGEGGESAGLEEKTSVFALLWFFVRPVRWPWFRAGLLSGFLGCPGARPPGSFRCARWGRPKGEKHDYSVTSKCFNSEPYNNS